MNGTSNNTDNFRKSDLCLRNRRNHTNNSHPCRTWCYVRTPKRVASSAPGIFMMKDLQDLKEKLRLKRCSSQPTKEKPQQFGLPERWSSQLDWNALENLKSTQRHRSLRTLIRQGLQEEDLQEEFCLKRCSSQPTKEKPQ